MTPNDSRKRSRRGKTIDTAQGEASLSSFQHDEGDLPPRVSPVSPMGIEEVLLARGTDIDTNDVFLSDTCVH